MASHAINPFHRIPKWNGFYFGQAQFIQTNQVTFIDNN